MTLRASKAAISRCFDAGKTYAETADEIGLTRERVYYLATCWDLKAKVHGKERERKLPAFPELLARLRDGDTPRQIAGEFEVRVPSIYAALYRRGYAYLDGKIVEKEIQEREAA